MIAIVTIVLALPLGLLVRNRMAAYLAYAVVFAQVYTFQTANLLMEWVNGSTKAFPRDGSTEMFDGTLGYFWFTSAIYAVGFGLVTLGHWLRNRRRTERNAIHVDTPAA